jgi:hypothetical protein
MRKLLVAAALTTLAAPGRLHAQAPPSSSAAAPPIETLAPPRRDRPDRENGGQGQHGPHRPRLFISPSGEPFRSGDGLAAWFAQADADHDGAITASEFQADALRAFKLYDANGDGVIDGFEIQAYEHDRVPEIAEILIGGEDMGDRRGGGGRRSRRGGRQGGGNQGGGEQAPGPAAVGAGREGAARFSLLNEPEPLLAADADVDGKVTLAEWTRATARRFATLDKDHSGRLTLEKLRPQKPKS